MSTEDPDSLEDEIRRYKETHHAELELVRQFRDRFGFTPRPYLSDRTRPGGYEARLRRALETGDATGLHPLRRINGLLLD